MNGNIIQNCQSGNSWGNSVRETIVWDSWVQWAWSSLEKRDPTKGGGVTAQDHLDWGGTARHGLGTSGDLPYGHWELEEASSAEGGIVALVGVASILFWLTNLTWSPSSLHQYHPWSPAGGTTILRVVRHSPALREGSLWSSQAVKNHSHPAPGFYWATYLQKRPRLLDQLAWYNWLSDWIPQQETPEDIKKKLSIGLSVGHE